MSALHEIGQSARRDFPGISHNALGLGLLLVGLSCHRRKHLVRDSKTLPDFAP
jgi:hypothetical protein